MSDAERVFVTGGTGFIGMGLVRALADSGFHVRVLTRRERIERPPGWDPQSPGPFEHARVEPVRGDILDLDSLRRGIEGCRRVFHLAAYAKNWAADRQTFYRHNVEGLRNVMTAAHEHAVERLVWTSSIVTLGPTPPGIVGDETMPRSTARYLTEYEESKAVAEAEALRWAAEGLPIVIVNPTRVYGPGRLSEGNALARLIDDYDRGRVPVLLNRGVNVGNYVLVDDVVRGHQLAMDRGRPGERYILGGENATLREFFRTIDRISGRRHWQIPLGRLTPLAFAYLQQQRAEWFGVYPVITPGWVRTFLVDSAYSSRKAERELGYHATPLAEGLRTTYQWLQRLRQERK